jgi:hypothetical protein
MKRDVEPKPSEFARPDLRDAYREMAADKSREREAMEWAEGLIGDALESADASR